MVRFVIVLALIFGGAALMYWPEFEVLAAVMVFAGVVCFPIWLIGVIVRAIKRYADNPQTIEAAKRYDEERAKRKNEKLRRETVVEVKLIGGGSSKQTKYGLEGAILGGLLFNLPGAIVGSMIPKGTEYNQRFAVKYADGHVEIKEAHPNSWEYKKLIKYVKFEDLK